LDKIRLTEEGFYKDYVLSRKTFSKGRLVITLQNGKMCYTEAIVLARIDKVEVYKKLKALEEGDIVDFALQKEEGGYISIIEISKQA